MLTSSGLVGGEKIRLEKISKIGKKTFKEILYCYHWNKCPKFSGEVNKVYLKNNKISLQASFELRPNQKLIVDYIYETFRNQYPRCGANCILDTGQGKTFVAFGLIKKLKRKTLYVVHSTKAMIDTYDLLSKYFTCSIGKQKEDTDIVVAVINTVLTMDLKCFTFIIFDEVHKYMTQSRIEKIFFRGGTSLFSLGLTASPEKIEWKWRSAELLIGPKIVCSEIDGYNPEEVVFDGIVNAIPHHNNTEIVRNDKKWRTVIGTINNYIEDDERTELILYHIRRLIDMGKNIYVFAEINDYLINLLFEIQEYDPVLLISGVTPDVLEAAKSARIILTNYAYGSEQMSYPHMDALILATPIKNNITQVTGRILRMNGNASSIRYIVDIVDDHFKDQFRARKKVYLKRGFTIE